MQITRNEGNMRVHIVNVRYNVDDDIEAKLTVNVACPVSPPLKRLSFSQRFLLNGFELSAMLIWNFFRVLPADVRGPGDLEPQDLRS